MAFVSGPRQVGKTTACRQVDDRHIYLSWDDPDDRRAIVRGPGSVAELAGVHHLAVDKQTLVLDELHKYPRWRTFLKGLFDKQGDRLRIIVTGSSRLDLYRRGGDSLMGRYLLYRMHPLSVGELCRAQFGDDSDPVRPCTEINPQRLQQLWTFGGFPEPFSRADRRFFNQWRRLRFNQLVREDVRDTTRIQQIAQLETLVAILEERSGLQLKYSSLAADLSVAVDTLRRWIVTLTSLHHGFVVRPWFRNVAKSLRKEPKWYLRDWSVVRDVGQRAETFVACHLLKAVQTWEDLGCGQFSLHYLRDKEKREVDFLVVRNGKPWFLVEVKKSDTSLSRSLAYYQRQLAAPHAFQAVIDLPWVGKDCFSRTDPCVVPASTLLSQLP